MGAGAARDRWAVVVAMAAAILVAVSVPAVWVNRMVTDTEYYVETVAPVARDPEIQDVVATAATDAIVNRLDIEGTLEGRLPAEIAFLAAPINAAVEEFVGDQAQALVRSDGFVELWDETNRTGHAAFVAAVTGKQNGVVQAEAGTLTLDLGLFIERIEARLGGAGLGTAGAEVIGLDRTITLYQSDSLARVAGVMDALQRLARALPFAGIALAVCAVALARDRRRTLLWLGSSLLVTTLVPLQAIYLGEGFVSRRLESAASIPPSAEGNAYNIVFRSLIDSERLVVTIALLITAGAILAGPSRWARALRHGLSGGISGVSERLEFGILGEWASARIRPLRAAGFLAAAVSLVVLPTPRTPAQVWWVAALVVLWLLGVQLLGSGSVPDERDGDPRPEAGP